MKKRHLALGIATVAAVTFLITTAGYYYLFGLNQISVSQFFRLAVAARYIEANYVDEVDTEKLIGGALAGMASSMGDPHSVYLDEKMYKMLQEHTDGSFGGVGVVMGIREDKVPVVISPIEGTPSDVAGIKSGDRILAVDGVDTKTIPYEEIAARIRGAVGTEVVLSIRREGEEDKDYILTRSNIETKSVAGEIKEDGIGYIRIASFNEHTATEFNKIYAELEQQGMKKIILDLRGNPGGVLPVCAKVAEKFVPEGVIVSTRDRNGHEEVFRSSLKSVPYPAVVLVDNGSASASEIVAGAIQDTGAGILVGTKTYGKGSVQAVINLQNNDGLKLTIARYYTPNGRCIDGIGIEPDVVVEAAPESGKDVQMEKALEIIREK